MIIQYNGYTPTAQNVRFKDGKSKILLDFGADFEFGATYNIDKIVTDRTGSSISALGVDFSRLSTLNDIYTLTKSGANGFKAEIAPQYSTMGILYKSNFKTMNNFDLISNALIYPHKYKGTNRSARKRVIRRVRKTASLFDSLETNQTRHTERSEVSKTHKSNKIAESMIKDKTKGLALDSNSQSLQDSQDSRIDSSLQQNDLSDFASSDLDSSLTLFAQNDEESISYNNESLANDESFTFDSLPLNESFFYKSDSLLLADIQSERQRRMRNSTQNLNTRSVNQANSMNQSNNNSNSINSTNRTTITNQTMNRTTQNDKYYFILTPFINHNYFFESGRYNLSGLEYGFVTAFSGKLNNTNALGTHFVFSYGSLKDSADKEFDITSMNINLGLNYKLDLIYAMYLKARIDGFYFLNEVQNTMSAGGKIKPNTIGFGASVSYGKEWDFNNYGLLGLEVALDYKGLYASETTINVFKGSTASYSDIYQSALYNMLYVDLGLNYDKYFSSKVGLWGLNTKLGVKANATANKLATSKISALNNTRNLNMTLDNDLVLAYLNIGGSYVLNTKDFDMEFSLAFYGNYGNRTMSNGGGFEWRVGW